MSVDSRVYFMVGYMIDEKLGNEFYWPLEDTEEEALEYYRGSDPARTKQLREILAINDLQLVSLNMDDTHFCLGHVLEKSNKDKWEPIYIDRSISVPALTVIRDNMIQVSLKFMELLPANEWNMAPRVHVFTQTS